MSSWGSGWQGSSRSRGKGRGFFHFSGKDGKGSKGGKSIILTRNDGSTASDLPDYEPGWRGGKGKGAKGKGKGKGEALMCVESEESADPKKDHVCTNFLRVGIIFSLSASWPNLFKLFLHPNWGFNLAYCLAQDTFAPHGPICYPTLREVGTEKLRGSFLRTY